MKTCLCGKKKSFSQCCGRFLSGKQKAKTPEQLMRSRYCAYALGGYGAYLIETWAPETAKGLNEADLSKKSTFWHSLSIISASQQGNQGIVEFKAEFYMDKDSNHRSLMHEVSEFIRVQGQWLYLKGTVTYG